MLRVLALISVASAALAANNPCPPAKRAPLVNPSAYVIQVGDTIYVSDGQDQYTVPIGPDGKIGVPLIGFVQAAGRTVWELEVDIDSKLKTYVRQPKTRVTVARRASSGPLYFVDGEVARPGEFPKEGTVTVVDAIEAAGGLKKSANRKRIFLLRKDHAVVRLKYQELTHPMFVEDGDHVVVPKR